MSDVGQMLHSAAPDESPRGTDLLRVLEDRIGELIDRHRGAQKRIAELQARVDASEAQVSELSGRAAAADNLRDELRKRVARLLVRVEAIELIGGDGS